MAKFTFIFTFIQYLNSAEVNLCQRGYWLLHSSHSSPHTELPAGRWSPAQHTALSGLNPWPAAQRTETDARTPHFPAPNMLTMLFGWTGSLWRRNMTERQHIFYHRQSCHDTTVCPWAPQMKVLLELSHNQSKRNQTLIRVWTVKYLPGHA